MPQGPRSNPAIVQRAGGAVWEVEESDHINILRKSGAEAGATVDATLLKEPAEQALRTDRIFDAIVVQRSRGVAAQLNKGVTGLMKKNKITVFDGHGKRHIADGAGGVARRSLAHQRDGAVAVLTLTRPSRGRRRARRATWRARSPRAFPTGWHATVRPHSHPPRRAAAASAA